MIRRSLAVLALLFPLAALATTPEPPRLRTSGGEVTLPWNDFEELYRRGQAPKDKPDPTAPRAWTLDRAVYTGRVEGTGDDAYAVFKTTLRGEVLQEGWVTVPLLSTVAALKTARLGAADAPVYLQDGWYTLITDKRGAFVVELEFAVPLFTADGETGLSVPLAPSGATEVSFVLASAEDVSFEVAGAPGHVVARQGGNLRVDAAIPSGASLAISWQRALPEEEAREARVYAETNVLVGVGEGVMQGSASVAYTVLHKGVDKLRVQVPKDVAVLDVTGPGIRDWTQKPDGTVEVVLNYAALGAYRLNVVYERALGKGGGAESVPLVRALDVTREKTWVGVDARSALELVAGEATGAQVVDVRELPADIVGRTDFPVLLAWKARGGDVAIPVEVRSHPDVDMLVTLLDTVIADTLVTDDGRRMTRVRYAVRNNRNQFLRLQLPEKAEVWSASVAGRGVKVAKGEGGVLVPLVRSDAGGGAMTAFLVELIYVEDGAPLADGKGNLRVELPRASAPASQLQWSVWFPAEAKVGKKTWDGTVQHVDWFSTSPEMPSNAVVSNQVQQQVHRAVQEQDDAGALGQGVEPVRVDLPLSGQTLTFEKMLVLDEPLWVSFDYKRKG